MMPQIEKQTRLYPKEKCYVKPVFSYIGQIVIDETRYAISQERRELASKNMRCNGQRKKYASRVDGTLFVYAENFLIILS